MKYPQNYRIQDCINLQGKGQPLWIRFDIKNSGMLAMPIQLPKIKNQRNRYPQIRYFLSKYNTQQQKSKSHIRQDIPSSQFIQNMYIESTCDKWDCYRIDFVQGYHNNASFYTKVMTGHYVLFIDVQYKGKFNLRIDSHVQMTCPQIFQPTLQLRKQIFDSTFYSISQESGVQASLSQDSFDQSISLNNDFQELGFGSICIKTLSKAKQKVAMKIYPQKLKAVGLQLVSHYHQMQLDQNKQKNILLVSDSGKPQIVILQRIDNRRKSQIGQIFPPPGTVQFFKITPKTGLIITERKK